MSITTGFECFLAYDLEGRAVYKQDVVEQLLAHTRALETMLRKHEFVLEQVYSFCPECGGMKTGNGHSPDCQLAKLLDGVE